MRGYVSCVIECPYEGAIAPTAVADMAYAMFQLGCYEISLGDTIGSGTPDTVTSMLHAVLLRLPASRLAIHCHDTQGHALANIRAALELGIRVVDTSVGGLGGCPYAGANVGGNVATESVVAALQEWGVATDVNLVSLQEAAAFIRRKVRVEQQRLPQNKL